MGERDIPKVLEEAKKEFAGKGTNVSPSIYLRILALLNHFKKEGGRTGLSLNDKMNIEDYLVLKTLARKTHDEMGDELLKDLKRNGDAPNLPKWSNVASATKAKYIFKLESKAISHGFPINRCKDSWAADRLLYDSHKNRSFRSALTKTSFDNGPCSSR